MNIPRTSARVTASLAVAALMTALAGGAYAYWRGGGSGSGSATAGTNVAVTLSPAAPGAALAPGGQTNVVLTASNPNASNVHLSALALDATQGTSGYAVDAGHSACALAALSYATQTNGGTGWTVAPKVGGVNGTLSLTLTNALSMTTSAANACQGASFTVYLAAS